MKAAFIKQFGGPDHIQYGELPAPRIQQNEVLVQVEKVSVNHVDTYVRSGGFKTAVTFPLVISRDMVGKVLEVGPAVSDFKPGDFVWANSMGYDGRQGVASERAAIPAERLFHVPVGVDRTQLIASVHSSATAAIVLSDIMQAKIGQSILIEGAAGHVGSKFVQLARTMGLTVITTSNEKDFSRLSQLGSQMTLPYRVDINDQLHQQFPNGVDHIIDTSGQVELQSNFALLNQGGDVTLIAAPKTNQFAFDVRAFYTAQKQLHGFVISHATLPQLQQSARVLNSAFSRGLLLDDRIMTRPLSEAAWAHETLETGQDAGRRILLAP
ncbi:alcohol dehydrogenase catalytic domain-containing protein [Secundilactobacillus folii]|uniref:Zinc-binding dehydrogenase n=1 Tax=Secundilactobacillus folii TaxID=2678357 RepID=A0A7X3C2R0_9LACO|nr:zinc-binding dehydrogenase [Secundilactobacillus folii]MTV83115.1 zinc-binding dehydrogenase [Secundilactobacillus folii]